MMKDQEVVISIVGGTTTMIELLICFQPVIGKSGKPQDSPQVSKCSLDPRTSITPER